MNENMNNLVKKNIHRKYISVIVIVLFLSLALAPSIHANIQQESLDSELVEITTEICGLPGLEPQTVKLSQEDAQAVDKLFDEIKLKLDNVESREEAVEIFNEAIVELDKHGLLGGLSVRQAQRLVKGRLENSKYVRFLESKNNRIHAEANENWYCFIAGFARDSDVLGPFWMFRELLFPLIIYPLVWPFLLLRMIVMNIFPWYLLAFISYGGKIEESNTLFPSTGWVWTYGSNGTVQWDGSFYGHERDMTFELQLLKGNHYYVGAAGFCGLVLRAVGEHYLNLFHLGWAFHVKIAYDEP